MGCDRLVTARLFYFGTRGSDEAVKSGNQFTVKAKIQTEKQMSCSTKRKK